LYDDRNIREHATSFIYACKQSFCERVVRRPCGENGWGVCGVIEGNVLVAYWLGVVVGAVGEAVLLPT